jgi:hypothetical protein
MATLFLDFENGNDNYGGTSFAVLRQGTNGRITSTTFSSVGASFPNDGSLIGQYLSIFNGTIYAVYNITAWVSSTSLTIAAIAGGTALANQATDRQYFIGGRWKGITNGATAVRTVPGDTVRMMGSPAPTSLGQAGVWTSQALQATKATTGATNAAPISITCAAHGYSTGDTVVVTGVGGNGAANGTWEITNTGINTFTLNGSTGSGTYSSGGTARLRNNTRVMLTSAVTQNIASTGPGRAAWAASANVTATLSTTQKEHLNSDSIAIATGFTTGLAAYWTLPSTLDLSGYQQVSLWIQQTVGTVGAAGAVNLRLCSDTAGATAVNTISIPSIASLSRWIPVTVDLGTNLGSSIRSIALYVNTDNGAQTFLLNNIIACKASSAADSLTLTSLIGKNTTGETFWAIQSINGIRVMLDADTNQGPTSTAVRGYYGTSETVTTWKRETIKLGPTAASNNALNTIQEGGVEGSPITYSGGWDRTSMSTQNLETWLDGQNGNGYLINSNASQINTEKWAGVKCDVALFTSGSRSTHNIIAANNTSGSLGALYVASGQCVNLTIGHVVANGLGGGILFSSGSSLTSGILTVDHGVLSCAANGIILSTTGNPLISALRKGSGAGLVANSGTAGISLQGQKTFVDSIKLESNSICSVASPSGAGDGTVFLSCSMADAVEYTGANYEQIYSHNHDQIAGNHKIFMNGGLISSATDQRKTASGIAWKLQPTSTTLRTSETPVVFSLAKVAVSANNLVTIKAWMRRDNSGLTLHLVVKGGQIAGVPSDVVSAVSANNVWSEQAVTFTPTEIGVVEVTAEAWGGTTFSGWVDDLTITQA